MVAMRLQPLPHYLAARRSGGERFQQTIVPASDPRRKIAVSAHSREKGVQAWLVDFRSISDQGHSQAVRLDIGADAVHDLSHLLANALRWPCDLIVQAECPIQITY